MANIKTSARRQDTALFCGAVIRNVRENKSFSCQTLYTEVTGKKNPNRAYLLRDALVGIKVLLKHRDGSYTTSKQNYDPQEVVDQVLAWIGENKPSKQVCESRRAEDVLEVWEDIYCVEGRSMSNIPSRIEISQERYNEIARLNLPEKIESAFSISENRVKLVHVLYVDTIVE